MNQLTATQLRSKERNFTLLARGGYVAKGVVYGTVGVLALMTVFGFADGQLVGARGAITELGQQGYGKVILALLAIGLAAFMSWRFVQAIADPDRKGSGAKALAARAGLAVSGLIYAGLAIYTVRLGFFTGGGGSSSGADQKTATLLSQDFGVWMVGAVGFTIIGVGLYQLKRVIDKSFRKHWKTAEMGPDERTWATRISRAGILARSASFVLIGWFLLQAALTHDPSEARGLQGALQTFASGSWGTVWLFLIALGFVCYGVYCGVNARYRRVSLR